MEYFEKNYKALKKKNWIKEVQKTLTKHTSANQYKNENLAFKLLCEKAPEINKHLTDIQAFFNKFSKDTSTSKSSDDLDKDSDKDLHEDFDQGKDEKRKQLLMVEAKRLVKVMGDIAAYLNIDCYTKRIRSLLYDMETGGLQDRGDGSMVEVNLKNLSDEQFKLTPFIWSSHLPPEEQGNGS
jgi:hypothetical protein